MSTTTTLARSSDKEPAPAPAKHGPRLDIQGLRAVAVLSVVANHLWGWPHGGFIGVDVFFVVSGFLITGLLIRERQRSGRISFSAFYRRRIRRIMPAATAVIVVTVIATSLVISVDRATDVGRDGIWAFFFAANWHFALEGTDYFNNGAVSPLQHYWSLAVEEQFYLVWPWVVLLGFRVSRGRAATRTLFVLMGSLTVASFVYALWHTANEPTWAYFSTFDRAWELGVGALLALGVPALRRLPSWLAGSLGWIGLVGIFVSFFVVEETPGFPAPWAALPVLATAAVIAGGVGHAQRHLVPLVNPVARYIGDLSYSLYLWHFPVIILLIPLFPDGGLAYSVWCLALMATLSVASYHLIEDPIRHSEWLEPKTSRKRRAPKGEPDRKLQVGWAAVLLVVTAGLVALSLRPVAPSSTVSIADLRPATGGAGGETVAEQQAERVELALQQEAFPRTFTPSLESIGWDQWAEEMRVEMCVDVGPDNVTQCRYGSSATKTAAILGDSYAMAWTPGIVEAMTGRNYGVQQLTFQQCPAWDVEVKMWSGAAYPECGAFRDWAVAEINKARPDIVFLSTAYATSRRFVGSGNEESPFERIRDGLAATIDAIKPSGARIVVLASPPTTGNLTECVTRLGSPEDCAGEISDEWQMAREAELAAIAEAERSEFVETWSWFCGSSGDCPGFVGTTPVMTDGQHLSRAYSEQLAPLIVEAVLGSGRATR